MIKTRADENSLKSYTSINEIIHEFKSIFNIFNKIIKGYADLYNLKFEMKSNNKNESFKIFYTRFNAIIISLKFIEIFKIFNLTRLISIRFQYKIMKQTFITFREVITYIRKLDLDFRVINNLTGIKREPKNKEKPKSVIAFNSNQRNTFINENIFKSREYKYPQPLMTRIKKKGRCFKCLKTGHHSSDNNVPCKNADPLSKEQMNVMLKTVDVENNIIDHPTFELSEN